MQLFGYCPKCHQMRFLEKHHVMPRRFFGKKSNNCKLAICENCHKEIEDILPREIRLSKKAYRQITKQWLLGNNPKVMGGHNGTSN